MTEIRDALAELRRFKQRLLILFALVFAGFSLLAARLVWLQVLRHDKYVAQAEDNRIALVPIVPNRGLILDRNGVVLASNYSAYTLEITPSKLEANMDSVIDELSKLVTIEAKDRKRFKRLLEESKNFASVPIRTRLTDDEVARFTAQRFRFPGVEVQARLFRQYPLGEIASHVLGYIGRINQKEAKAIEDSEDAANYKGTDHIGKEGLEKSYEKQLHGVTGYEEVERSAGGRVVRALGVLAILVFSKYIYMASLQSYYTFYLIERFQVPVDTAQLYLFLFLAAVAIGTFAGGPIGDRIGRRRVIWVSILGAAPFTIALPYMDLFWTGVLSVVIGLIMSSAFSAIVVFAQELVPGKVGMIAGIFFGLMFGISGIGAAAMGHYADLVGIAQVLRAASFLPLLGVLAALLPRT